MSNTHEAKHDSRPQLEVHLEDLVGGERERRQIPSSCRPNEYPAQLLNEIGVQGVEKGALLKDDVQLTFVLGCKSLRTILRAAR